MLTYITQSRTILFLCLPAQVDLLYNFLSANRLSLGGAFDVLIAAKRVEMSKQGVQTCGDVDEECSVEW
jgi:hypothetical protein